MNKLQYLLVSELLKNGSVELLLPDGITLQVGILQEDKMGDLRKAKDYCYVVATRDGKSTILDSYNLGLQFEAEEHTIIYEDEDLNENGDLIRSLDVV
jgi:hypothetical protein